MLCKQFAHVDSAELRNLQGVPYALHPGALVDRHVLYERANHHSVSID